MRDESEIQKAHTIFSDTLIDFKGIIPTEIEDYLSLTADVLCWVLGHPHPTNMEDSFSLLEKWLLDHGIEYRQRVH